MEGPEEKKQSKETTNERQECRNKSRKNEGRKDKYNDVWPLQVICFGLKRSGHVD
jgi:hypothetical protein